VVCELSVRQWQYSYAHFRYLVCYVSIAINTLDSICHMLHYLIFVCMILSCKCGHRLQQFWWVVFQMIMDGVTFLVLVISTWQAEYVVPDGSLEGGPDAETRLSWLWLSVKLQWCVMVPVLFGTWHRVAVLKTSKHSLILCNNLEQDVSLKSEVAKNWRSRCSIDLSCHKCSEPVWWLGWCLADGHLPRFSVCFLTFDRLWSHHWMCVDNWII